MLLYEAAYVFFGPSVAAVWSMAVVMVMGDMAGFSSSAAQQVYSGTVRI